MRKFTFFTLLTVIFFACSSKDNAAPDAPYALKLQQMNTSTIRLTWVNPTTAFEGVVIERAIDDEAYAELATLPSSAQIYQDRNLSKDGIYRYRVATYNGEVKSEYAEAEMQFSSIPSPTDATYEKASKGIIIKWKDNCKGEDGYLVRRKVRNGSFENWKTNLEPDTEMVADPDAGTGVYVYEIYAFDGDSRSLPAVVTYSNIIDPVVTVNKAESSYYQVHIEMLISDDGGNDCEVGICWKEDGSAGATVNDKCFTYPRSGLHTGDIGFGSAVRLQNGKSYIFRPWVRYEGMIKYLEPQTLSLKAQPAAKTLTWTTLTSYSMPSSIELKKAEFTSSAGSVEAFVAIADMDKAGAELELRTVCGRSSDENTYATGKTSAAVKNGWLGSNVYVAVNGGFCANDQSYSYVFNRGKFVPNAAKAAGVKSVTRKYWDKNKNEISGSFPVTRGAFGVDANQNPSVKWLYADNTWAYDMPLPSFNSGPALTPTNTFPSTKHTWNIYSAIGGGPIILYEGNICFDHLVTKDSGGGVRYIGNPELLDDDIFGPSTNPPRTAIGHTADGKIVIITVSSTSSISRRGVTLEELACIMKGLGCVNALNLDGGGSTTFCVTSNGTVLNKPSDGSERSVGSWVALIKK